MDTVRCCYGGLALMLNTVCITHETLNPSYIDRCWKADGFWSTAEPEELEANPCKFLTFPTADPGPLQIETVCNTGIAVFVGSFIACLLGLVLGVLIGSLV